MSSYRKCPQCGKETIERIAREPLVKLLFWMPIKRFQCWSCDNRFYVKLNKNTQKTEDEGLKNAKDMLV